LFAGAAPVVVPAVAPLVVDAPPVAPDCVLGVVLASGFGAHPAVPNAASAVNNATEVDFRSLKRTTLFNYNFLLMKPMH